MRRGAQPDKVPTAGPPSICGRSESEQTLDKRAKASPEALSWAKCLQNGYGLQVFFVLSLLFVCANCETDKTQADNQCAPGVKTLGRTWPKGEIFLEDGEPLRIYCILDETLTDPELNGKNASDLVFYRENKKIEPEYVQVINSTTSMMYVEKVFSSENGYYCKLELNNSHSYRDHRVCMNKVVVGSKPMKPHAFHCISRNWANLTCTWDPVFNHIKTKFTIGFKLPGRPGRFFGPYLCPKKSTPNSCLWDPFTNPIYRQVYEYYTFILFAENVLGNATFTYKFHHYAHVIPSKPDNLSLVNRTDSSVMLHWNVPQRMVNFPPGLYHRISYQSRDDNEDTWTSVDIIDRIHAKEIYFNLTDLQFANTVYDVRVFIKSTKATGDDSWSQFSSITVKPTATYSRNNEKRLVAAEERQAAALERIATAAERLAERSGTVL